MNEMLCQTRTHSMHETGAIHLIEVKEITRFSLGIETLSPRLDDTFTIVVANC